MKPFIKYKKSIILNDFSLIGYFPSNTVNIEGLYIPDSMFDSLKEFLLEQKMIEELKENVVLLLRFQKNLRRQDVCLSFTNYGVLITDIFGIEIK